MAAGARGLGARLARGLSGAEQVGLIKIDGAIGPATATYISRAIDEAAADHDQCLIIEMDTPGGLLDSTRLIVEKLLSDAEPTVVFVRPAGACAASAGTFITLAADIAAMAPDTSIGAAHPVSLTGGRGRTSRWRIAPAYGLPRLNPPAYASLAEALAWADTEQASLLQAQDTAKDLGQHTLAWQFADTMWGWVGHRHDYPAWQAVCQTAAASARACGDPRAEVFALVRLASCHLARGQVQNASAIADQAIRTAQASGDRAGEGSAREHAAICAMENGDYHAAIAHSTRGLYCWRAITAHERAEALLERMLGRARAGLGDYQQAAAHLDTALAIFTRLDEQYPPPAPCT